MSNSPVRWPVASESVPAVLRHDPPSRVGAVRVPPDRHGRGTDAEGNDLDPRRTMGYECKAVYQVAPPRVRWLCSSVLTSGCGARPIGDTLEIELATIR